MPQKSERGAVENGTSFAFLFAVNFP